MARGIFDGVYVTDSGGALAAWETFIRLSPAELRSLQVADAGGIANAAADIIPLNYPRRRSMMWTSSVSHSLHSPSYDRRRKVSHRYNLQAVVVC